MNYKNTKNKLDRLFSEYIRKRDKDKPCISCGKKVESRDAGHFYSRDILSLRWDEQNVNGQCVTCNRFKAGNIENYRQGIIMRYGKDALLRLDRLSSVNIKYKIFDLDDIISRIEEKTENL